MFSPFSPSELLKFAPFSSLCCNIPPRSAQVAACPLITPLVPLSRNPNTRGRSYPKRATSRDQCHVWGSLCLCPTCIPPTNHTSSPKEYSIFVEISHQKFLTRIWSLCFVTWSLGFAMTESLNSPALSRVARARKSC